MQPSTAIAATLPRRANALASSVALVLPLVLITCHPCGAATWD